MIKEKINSKNTYLGIEFGSTRIKAVLIDDTFKALAQGGYSWENKYENGYWTYSMDDVVTGLQSCFAALSADVKEKYGETLTTVGAMGISGMMHGYLVFDKDDNLLAPFRTWRNTTTAEAAGILSKLFSFNIPQRWSIAHLYQAILNGEDHVKDISRLTTLAGHIHYLLSGRHEVGLGEASGMFPVAGGDYDKGMLAKFADLSGDCPFELYDILPAVRTAGYEGATLTEAGAALLDPTGAFKAGVPMCPPEGDAGTGMTATNAVLPGTGNLSAGTSVFSMLVLNKPLKGAYEEIDVCTTPDGETVAMVHSNNGCSELDEWVKMFCEFSALSGNPVDISECYDILYRHAMTADADCGGVTAYNFLAAEPVAGVERGLPMYFRTENSKASLGNMIRAQLYASVAPIRLGMELLGEKEGIKAAHIMAHGGLFKVKGVAQQILADALKTSVSTTAAAGEGGAWGMALLAAYMSCKGEKSLGQWLESEVFADAEVYRLSATDEGSAGYDGYMAQYKAGLPAYNGLKEV